MPVNRGNDELGLAKAADSLWSPHDTEAIAVADVVGHVVEAPRCAATAVVAGPVAATQQTGRPSRGPCGVCGWARGVVRAAIPILTPLPNIA